MPAAPPGSGILAISPVADRVHHPDERVFFVLGVQLAAIREHRDHVGARRLGVDGADDLALLAIDDGDDTALIAACVEQAVSAEHQPVRRDVRREVDLADLLVRRQVQHHDRVAGLVVVPVHPEPVDRDVRQAVVSRDRDLVRSGRQRQPAKLLEGDGIEEEGVAAPLVDRDEAGAARSGC